MSSPTRESIEPSGRPLRERADVTSAEEVRRGTVFGALAFLVWGSFPLYFRALEPASAVEILLHRIVWSLLVCLVVLAATRKLGAFWAVLRSPRLLATLSLAAVLIAVNWGVYIYAVNAGNVVEASLGYFINPLLTVLLGVVVLHERLRRLQWFAVAVGFVAVVVLTVDYGHPPWIALVLAASFGSYGLVKNRVGGRVEALPSLTTETAVLAPFALVALVWIEVTGRGSFGHAPPWHGLLLGQHGHRDDRAARAVRRRCSAGTAVDDGAAAVHHSGAAAVGRCAPARRARARAALGRLRAGLGGPAVLSYDSVRTSRRTGGS